MAGSCEVVISGIGGHFPECDNIESLIEKLYLGENLITLDERRWTPGKLGVDAHCGKVSEFQYFDNELFGIHRSLALVMDPIARLILERVAEAVFDAGFSLQELYGSRTSVYTSCSISENEATFIYSTNTAKRLAIIGSNRAMMANRVSYFFNFQGRSCAYDGTWAWAALGLQIAYSAITSGECDYVIMGGTSLCLHPEVSVTYDSMNYLSPDGVCRPFDADANGLTRAESQVVFLIQRADLAKRAYAKVLGAKLYHDGIQERELSSPTARTVASMVDSVYREYNIDKRRVKYIECSGLGYQPADYAEVEGLKRALCGNRDFPLLIGSVKGNAGNSEGPSGMVSLVKAMLILRSGVIPKTLNHNRPNPRIPSLVDGSVKVVNENTEIDVDDDTVVGSTSISYSGTVGHVALAVGSKNKVPVDPEKEIPRLIFACGRSESELKRILTKISSIPFDPEYYRLVQDIFSYSIKSYNYRGHIICPSPPDTLLNIEIGGRPGRPVWFVFSGMGSQWPGMGTDLLKIPAFAATIDRCHAVLATKGLDLRKILTDRKPDIFDNILHSFVGIAAVQVGLINIMRLLGIEADGFIGHSVGEQACAYMDGCIDEEQTMLAAYARGMASNEAKLIKGMMAAVGTLNNSNDIYLYPSHSLNKIKALSS